MTVNNLPKLVVLVVALICVTVLMALRVVEAGIGLGTFGTILGYAIGNGVAAKQGQPVQPVFAPSPDGPQHPDPDPSSKP